MAPKSKKKDPNQLLPIPEDVFLRAKRLQTDKVAVKPPKGELSDEDLCIPPAMHGLPEFKQVIHYWKQCATVAYAERKEIKAPSRMKAIESEAVEKKMHTRKDIGDLLKYLKSFQKQATKRTGQFLKNLEKKENKDVKREGLVKQIADVSKLMDEELRSSRRFAESQELFAKKYMIGTKLGEVGPKQRALIVLEVSDNQQQWIDNAKEEVQKLLYKVLQPAENTTTLNVATFSASGQTTWLPQYQPKDDPKKGIDDAWKWVGKNFSAKACGSQGFPPDWVSMLLKFAGEGVALPYRMYICCSKSPENRADVLQTIAEIRQNDPPGKGEPVLPLNIVAFDPSIVGDPEEKEFFDTLAGPSGSFMIDTSAEDLLALDKMLKAVGVKKKQLDKLNKKLTKMEDTLGQDFSQRVKSDRELFQRQVALQRMIENDYEICDWALKNDVPVPGPEI